MLPELPEISKIFIEKKDINYFQQKNIDKILNKIKFYNKTNFDLIYLEKDEIEHIVKKSFDSKNDNENNRQLYNLILQSNPGNYIKKCPGTPNYICCNYFITTFYVNCSLNCTYCFLKFYLKSNNLIIYYDLDNFLHQLSTYSKLRLGSGELSDSLLFDPFTNYSETIIKFLSKNPKMKDIIFEFKTKTTYIDPFLINKPIKNIVIGFSMNPENISKKYEIGASTVYQRLKAAITLIKEGWRVSFHFDPIIFDLDNNIKDYIELFDKLTDLPDESIAWFSLGALRYHPDMMQKLRKDEIGKSLLNYETITGLDGKIRYFIEKRIEIYKELMKIYRKKNCNFPLYYCMESDKVYLKTFGELPNKIDNLKDIFNFN